MTKNNKKPVGILRQAFRYAGGLIVGFNIAGPLAIQDQTPDIQNRTGLTTLDIRALTGAKTRFVTPEDKALKLFAYSTYSPQLIDETEGMRNDPHYVQGVAYKHAILGHGSLVDTVTLGLSGQIFACTIVFPSRAVTLADIQRTMISLPQDSIKNFPGTLPDYMKLIASHELTHCNQAYALEDHAEMENAADQGALDHFLKTGGDPDIARSFIYMRTISAMEASIFSSGTPQKYTGNPGLFSRYFNESVTVTPEIARKGFLEIGDVLQAYAAKHQIDPANLYKAPVVYAVINQILYDPGFKTTPEVRAVARLYQEAYEFFTIDPADRINVAAPLIPHIS